MDIYSLIEQRYDAAIKNLEDIIFGLPQTPQARYDLKKALAAGKNPVRRNKSLQKMRDQLVIEKQISLQTLHTVDAILEEQGGYESVREVLGCVKKRV